MIIESQREAVEFLASAESSDGIPVHQIDTHLSHIFLTDDRAYKMKRAVRYSFVDFSTVEDRRAACEQEAEVNRRTAPEMYLGTRPIYRTAKGLSWKGPGEIIEWVVVMRRFQSNQQFDELLEHNQLDDQLMSRLGDKLAKFHLEADEGKGMRGGDSIAKVIDGVCSSLSGSEMKLSRARAVERWTALALSENDLRRPMMDARRRHGWVRQCHGDLHLANICVFDGDPTPFDAIEFNTDLSEIDVLYDLAFALMDLTVQGRKDLANILLNRYLGITRDYAGLACLRLFLSVRAAIRAMVMSLPGHPTDKSEAAARYLDMAVDFLTEDSEPRLIAVSGVSGTGKSTLAKRLAVNLNGPCGAIILTTDIIRKRMRELTPENRLDPATYTADQAKQVYGRLFKDARRALRAGQTVILDATFTDRGLRETTTALADRIQVPFLGIWLTADKQCLINRVASRRTGFSDATVDVLLRQLATTVPPNDWTTVDASGTEDETLHGALTAVEEHLLTRKL